MGNPKGIVPKHQRYKNKGPKQFLQDVLAQKRFLSDSFEQYVRGARTLDFGEELRVHVPLPSETRFDQDGIQSELVIAHSVLEWIHVGGNGSWLGNSRRLKAATAWVKADDADRRKALLQTEVSRTAGHSLTEAVVSAYGEDYQMRIHKLLKRLEWLCRTARKHKGPTGVLGEKEAIYLDDLLKVQR